MKQLKPSTSASLRSPKHLVLLTLFFCFIYYYFIHGPSVSFPKVADDGPIVGSVPKNEPAGSFPKVADDDPALLNYLRENVLLPPAGPGKFTRSIYPDKRLGRSLLYPIVRGYLRNMTGGFFVECGANNGEDLSNTLDFEEKHGWTGLLVEGDPNPAKVLKGSKRNAWVAEACLSPEKYPMKLEMVRIGTGTDGILSGIKNFYKGTGIGATTFTSNCYPLASLLYALDRTVVDYFSLDVEGAELQVLKTIPWDKIRINVLSLEVDPEGLPEFKEYLSSVGMKFKYYVTNAEDFIHDAFFVHKDFKP